MAKTDISTLRNRRVWLLCNTTDPFDVATAVAMAARLRHEYLNPNICLCETSPGNLRCADLAGLRRAAQQHGIPIQEELYGNYCGDLTDAVAEYEPLPIAENLIYAGEVTHVTATENAAPLEIAKAFSGLSAVRDSVVTLTGDEPPSKLKGLSGQIKCCDFLERRPEEHLPLFNRLVAGTKTVIVANRELVSKYTDTCRDILRACAHRRIGVVLISKTPLPDRLADMVSREITVSNDARDPGMYVASNGIDAWGIDTTSGTVSAFTEEQKTQYLAEMKASAYDPERMRELGIGAAGMLPAQIGE